MPDLLTEEVTTKAAEDSVYLDHNPGQYQTGLTCYASPTLGEGNIDAAMA